MQAERTKTMQCTDQCVHKESGEAKCFPLNSEFIIRSSKREQKQSAAVCSPWYLQVWLLQLGAVGCHRHKAAASCCKVKIPGFPGKQQSENCLSFYGLYPSSLFPTGEWSR